MNLPDEIQSQAAVPRRENLVRTVFIAALRLLGQGTGQMECQARLFGKIMLEAAHIC